MLCVLAVFIPAFFMVGAARALFVPLALAVGFAMVASFLLSSTLVPILAVWFLRRHVKAQQDKEKARPQAAGGFASLQATYARLLDRAVGARWIVLAIYLIVAGLVVFLIGGHIGTEIFP